MSQRKFPGPWRAELNEGGNFVIKDARESKLECFTCQDLVRLRTVHIDGEEDLPVL
jgi:hypothetical protein